MRDITFPGGRTPPNIHTLICATAPTMTHLSDEENDRTVKNSWTPEVSVHRAPDFSLRFFLPEKIMIIRCHGSDHRKPVKITKICGRRRGYHSAAPASLLRHGPPPHIHHRTFRSPALHFPLTCPSLSPPFHRKMRYFASR